MRILIDARRLINTWILIDARVLIDALIDVQGPQQLNAEERGRAAAQAWRIDAGGAWEAKCGRRRCTTWCPNPELTAGVAVPAAAAHALRVPVAQEVA